MAFLLLFLLLFAGGCSFAPPLIQYSSELIPQPAAPADEGQGAYTIEGGVATYGIEGLRIKVEALSDQELNALFPEDSSKDRFSTNPYTYGDWINPVLGYTPKRFTVFRVSVINDIYAKGLLDPLKAQLQTDRGEMYHAYGIPSFSPNQSFERYYRALRGQSGNEFYRFDLRMGNVRSSAYLVDQKVFKGESYEGLIAFDPLEESVQGVSLTLRDFVLKFDASGQPLETVDIVLGFDQRVAKEVVERPEP